MGPPRADHHAAIAMPPLHVGVRELCEFVVRSGDLDRRFTPTPTAQQGIAGHRLIAQRRGPGWESEVTLEGHWQTLTVTGRADGLDRARQVIDEVKTHRGPIEAMSQGQRALHWAQARLYGWMLCQTEGFAVLTVRLVYLDVSSLEETLFSETVSAQSLGEFAHSLCERYLNWARQERAHQEARAQFLQAMSFPLKDYRPGQQVMISAVREACAQSQTLRIQAPTGLGKTLGALYPALKAMPERGLDRVYCLTARTTGRQLALETLALLIGQPQSTRPASEIEHAPPKPSVQPKPAAPLRLLELVARERGCEYPDRQCHPQSCHLAKGFYDRLPVARHAAVKLDLLDFGRVRAIALEHEICPYYLSHELLRHADVVVGDFNHWFDRHALLYSIATQQDWRVSLLIDEAHHLVDRTRQSYSAELAEYDVLAVKGAIPPSLRTHLETFINQWDILRLTHAQEANAEGWRLLREVPADWLVKLTRLNSAMGQWLAEQAIDPPRAVLEFYFRCQSFQDMADRFGEHSLCELRANRSASSLADDPSASGLSLALRNVVPAGFIDAALAAADSVVMFSATLQPEPFDRHLLGLPEDTRSLHLPSPFNPQHLQVRVTPVSTRFERRARTLNTIVHTILDQYRAQPGNYLAFFSSFDYLDSAFARLQNTPGAPPVWKQERHMTESRRHAFLARFQTDGQGIGFAVLGGAFGEGIDLPGTRLIGAFVATLGLPQIDPMQEAVRERLQTLFGFGFEFTYLYPGLQKVVQAAGRVIRSPSDRGVLVLMDERYTQSRIRRLLPAHWGLQAD